MKTQLLNKGLMIGRVFSKKGKNPLDNVEYEKRNSMISEPDGKVVFEMKDVEVPKTWSQLATDIAVSKYFRKAGVPGTGHEVSARQLAHRISHTIRNCGEGKAYFVNKDEADTFEDELNFLLINQYAAFNSPVWFNCGLSQEYGIKGNTENFAYDAKSDSIVTISNMYERPQCSACFIQSVKDDLFSIFDLVKNEAKLFKGGSGTGSNFSNLRSRYEKLGGGGKSSGLMSFLEVFDRAAGSIKSGGTTRRAAKMVCLDMDHPEIVDFIEWKMKEEKKVKALIDAGYPSDFNGEAYHTVSGQNANNSVRLTDDFMNAVVNDGKWRTTARTTGEVVNEYSARDLMNKICQSAWACADPGVQFDTTYNKWHTCAMTAPIRATNPCVTGDTRVLTNDGRWQRIDSILGKETEILVNTGFIHNAKIDGSFKTGHKKIYRLTTKSGYEMKLTADHKVFTVNRGFVPAEQLIQEDNVLLPTQEVAEIKEIGDPTFYQMLGVYLGDGCGGKPESIRGVQLTMDKELEIPVLDVFQNYVTNNYERITHKYTPATVQITPTSAKYYIQNKKVVAKLGEFVDLSLQSHEKYLSDTIFNLSLSEQKYVLQGLFTADGTVANYGEKAQYVALDSSSLQMLKDVQLLLLGFGIKSKLYKNRRAGKTTSILPDGKGGMKEYAVKEMHSLRISASSRIRFEKLIGFMPESYKNESLRKMNQKVGVYYDKPMDAFKSLEYIGEEDVYDLTEPMTHSFVANGIVVHNCSEYAFLDDTACNLSSINLMKFLSDDNKTFDVEKFRYACKIMFIAQEIIVGLSSYPTYSIARNSEDYRPLGLGYANLGTLLMVMGIPYDSEKAFTITGALTAIMTGHAYCVSAEMAAVKGSFNGYEKNKVPFMKVMNQHRDAAYKIDVTQCPANLLNAAREDWDNVIKLVEKHGARNAQATVLAPTGCLTPNSLVATDKGLVRLTNLGNINGDKWQEASFNVMTDEGPKKATKFYVNGMAETRKITTSSGYEIQGTGKHQVKILDHETNELKWKKFSEIEAGDIVPLATNTMFGETQEVLLPLKPELHWNSDYELQTPKKMSPLLAEIVGYFMGDGSLHSKGLRFCVSNDDADVVEHLRTMIKKVFNLDIHVTQQQGYKEVAVNSVPLTIWWDACGFSKKKPSQDHSGKGYTPYIPDAVLHTNDKNTYASFLRGLFEADGTVTQGNPSLSTASKEFSQEIKSLLLAIGLPTTTKIDISGWGKSELYVIRSKNISYNAQFAEQVGFIGKRKKEKIAISRSSQTGKRDYVYLPEELVEETVPVGSPHRNVVLMSLRRFKAVPRERVIQIYQDTHNQELFRALQFFYDVVETNLDGGIQPTYDISVPENVTYIANGFISHNTIGLLMDCDTTGVEPDFSLVKWKKLAGGGYFKIVNQSVTRALQNLGYNEGQIQDILDYMLGYGTFNGCPHINPEELKKLGFTKEQIEEAEKTVNISKSLDKYTPHINPDELKKRGLDSKKIEQAERYIGGSQTIEGAPYVKEEHYAVFDCANKCGRGKRFIDPMGHINIMAAAQPFISGSISKTVNLPEESTVQDIEKIYMEAWKIGLKAVALYRDNCKLSQPLSSGAKKKQAEDVADELKRETEEPLQAKRQGFTVGSYVGGQKVYLRTGEYPDGRLGEIFLDMHKEGAAFRSMLSCFAIAVSIGLQYGVPLEKFVKTFTFTRFEPNGITDHPNIKTATSVIDFVFRVLGMEYLGRTDFVHVSPQSTQKGINDFMRKVDASGNGHAKIEMPMAMPATNAKNNLFPSVTSISAMEQQLGSMMGDAPACSMCGHITVRNGSCYKCLNCGNSMGCS